MTLLFIRLFFLIISGVVGYQVGAINGAPVFGVISGFTGAAV